MPGTPQNPSRRSFLTAGAASLAAWSACSQAPEPARKPNIVFFLADDLGYGDISLEPHGAPDIRTPHTDSIGSSGVRFTQAYANAPECTPTRTAFMTGAYQQRVGGMECALGVGNVGRYDEAVWLRERNELGLPPNPATLPRLLKHGGYETACFGKWHLGYDDKHSPRRHGFDEYYGIIGGNANYFTHREATSHWPVLYQNGEQIEEDGYFTELMVDRALGWLRQRSAQQPFFLYLPFTAPHTPLQGPNDRDKVITDENFNRGDRATYVRMVEAMDDGIGRVLSQLNSMGVSDNTLVVFQSDNGGYGLSRNDPFQRGKGVLWEGGIRVPSLMRWPGVIPEGSTTPQVALTMDLLPTFLDAAGLPLPDNRPIDGINLMPVVRGEQDPAVRTCYWRYKRLENRRKAVLHGNMKYIWNNGDEYLYNLADDPGETDSLMDDFPDLIVELKGKLDEWEEEVRAPRLAEFRAG